MVDFSQLCLWDPLLTTASRKEQKEKRTQGFLYCVSSLLGAGCDVGVRKKQLLCCRSLENREPRTDDRNMALSLASELAFETHLLTGPSPPVGVAPTVNTISVEPLSYGGQLQTLIPWRYAPQRHRSLFPFLDQPVLTSKPCVIILRVLILIWRVCAEGLMSTTGFGEKHKSTNRIFPSEYGEMKRFFSHRNFVPPREVDPKGPCLIHSNILCKWITL